MAKKRVFEVPVVIRVSAANYDEARENVANWLSDLSEDDLPANTTSADVGSDFDVDKDGTRFLKLISEAGEAPREEEEEEDDDLDDDDLDDLEDEDDDDDFDDELDDIDDEDLDDLDEEDDVS